MSGSEMYGLAQDGDEYGPHIWDQLVSMYGLLSDISTVDPEIKKEVDLKLRSALAAKEGYLPEEAWDLSEASSFPQFRSQFVRDLNNMIINRPPCFGQPIEFDLKAIGGGDVKFRLKSSYFNDLQSWAMKHITKFRTT